MEVNIIEMLSGREDESWKLRASCIGEEDLFIPPHGASEEDRKVSEIAAKGICANCIVREICLDDALSHEQQEGVWGGLNKKEREVMGRRIGIIAEQ